MKAPDFIEPPLAIECVEITGVARGELARFEITVAQVVAIPKERVDRIWSHDAPGTRATTRSGLGRATFLQALVTICANSAKIEKRKIELDDIPTGLYDKHNESNHQQVSRKHATKNPRCRVRRILQKRIPGR